MKTLGLDACLDHHSSDVSEDLVAATPEGIDVYFESVAARSLMRFFLSSTPERACQCAIWSRSTTRLASLMDLMGQILRKRITLRVVTRMMGLLRAVMGTQMVIHGIHSASQMMF